MKKPVAAAAKITKLQLDVARLLATHWVLFPATFSSLPTLMVLIDAWGLRRGQRS